MEGFWKTVIVTLVILTVTGLALLFFERRPSYEIKITPGLGNREKKIGIFGAVNEPGYYTYNGDIRIEEAVKYAGGLTEDADKETANLAKWVDDGETIIIPTTGPNRPTLTPLAEENAKIDLNSADADELMKLPGIGKKRAEDIIRLREQKGGFTEKEDILEISGISENLLRNIYDRLIIQRSEEGTDK